MFPLSLRLKVCLSMLVVLGWPAVGLANHHHIGGSGSGGGDDPNADCLVWGYVVVDGGTADGGGVSDADASDAGDTGDAGDGADAAQPPDAATSDGSAPPAGAVLVCLEHATLFGCDCTASPAARDGWSLGAVALVAAALLLAARRRRRAASPGGTR